MIVRAKINRFLSFVFPSDTKVSEETIQAIKRAEKPPLIIPFLHKNEISMMETQTHTRIKDYFMSEPALRRITSDTHDELAKKNKNKNKKFNFFEAKPDVENCNGWSTVLTHKDLKALKSSHIEAFMVNLSKVSFFF